MTVRGPDPPYRLGSPPLGSFSHPVREDPARAPSGARNEGNRTDSKLLPDAARMDPIREVCENISERGKTLHRSMPLAEQVRGSWWRFLAFRRYDRREDGHVSPDVAKGQEGTYQARVGCLQSWNKPSRISLQGRKALRVNRFPEGSTRENFFPEFGKEPYSPTKNEVLERETVLRYRYNSAHLRCACSLFSSRILSRINSRNVCNPVW